MNRQTENKIILVIRESRLDELIARYNTVDQARFYVEHLGADFEDYLQEHARYTKAIAEAERVLKRLGRVQTLQRQFLPNFIFGEDETVVVIGQDGLVANTLKYLDGQAVVGVNPDPARWDGALLPFRVDDLHAVIPEVFAKMRKVSHVTMAEAELTDGQTLYAVNDLFVGAGTHVSARYKISVDGKEEEQSSSGVIVSTGMGSTGWLKSVVSGAAGIAGVVSDVKPAMPGDVSFAWDAECLAYSVREPFPSRTTGISVIFGKITRTTPMRIESHMAGNGVIFSDGVEQDFLEFNAGMQATIRVAGKCGTLVV